MTTYLVTHYAASNDVNGNPRRCFVARKVTEGSDYAEVAAVVDEGNAGGGLRRIEASFPSDWKLAFDPTRVEVTPAEYRMLLKIGKRLDVDRKLAAHA